MLYHTAQVFALLWTILLPKVEQSLYFHQQVAASGSVNKEADAPEQPKEISNEQFNELSVAKKDRAQPLQLLWSHFHLAYTNVIVLQWSLWYAISLAGSLQVATYMQVLWKSFENEPKVSKKRIQFFVIPHSFHRLYGMGS